jgi:hypothetical protein
VNTDYFETNQGLDLINPPIRKAPGSLIIANNVEVTEEATERMVGYERVDGRPSPSEALYSILNFDAGLVEISVDDDIEGGTSGATAVVLLVVLESGAWGTDAAGYLVVGEVTGVFTDDEDIEVSATPMASADGAQAIGAANTPELDAEYFGLAYEYR